MQNYAEIDKIRKDAQAVRSLATRLLSVSRDWTDWELDFLHKLRRHAGPEALTTRQGEKLIELRDEAEYHSHYKGLSVATLLDRCFLLRDDLAEPDARFIEKFKAARTAALNRRALWRLLFCCRQLGEIEPHMLPR